MPGLDLTDRGGIWYATGTVAGERIRKSLGTRDKARAHELRAAYEARLWKRHSYGEEAVRTFEEAALRYMEAGGEARFLPPLITRFRGRVLGSIKPEELKEAARALYPDTKKIVDGEEVEIAVKSSTRNRQGIVPARAVINHAAELGWCPKISVKLFSVEKVQRRAANRAWLDAFLDQADTDRLSGLAAAVLFMWQNGPRVSEVTRVVPEDIDLAARTIVLRRTKTGEFETRHITRELRLRLAALTMADDSPVFGYSERMGIYHRMQAVCRRAGIAFLPPHQAGRHSFATTALGMGASVKQVMEASGWKSARMVLEIYAHAENAGQSVTALFDADSAQPKMAKARKPSGSRHKRK